jgi:hypothetical protein
VNQLPTGAAAGKIAHGSLRLVKIDAQRLRRAQAAWQLNWLCAPEMVSSK